jgi:hypothetical protein
MSSTDEAWLILLLTGLFGLLAFLRLKFPNASRSAETVVLLSATILFFLIYSAFPGAPAPVHSFNPLVILKSDVAHPSNTRADRIR